MRTTGGTLSLLQMRKTALPIPLESTACTEGGAHSAVAVPGSRDAQSDAHAADHLEADARITASGGGGPAQAHGHSLSSQHDFEGPRGVVDITCPWDDVMDSDAPALAPDTSSDAHQPAGTHHPAAPGPPHPQAIGTITSVPITCADVGMTSGAGNGAGNASEMRVTFVSADDPSVYTPFASKSPPTPHTQTHFLFCGWLHLLGVFFYTNAVE